MIRASVFVLFALVSSSLGFGFWNDLRATWAPTPDGGYGRLPRNTVDAAKEGWILSSTTCENDNKFSGFRWVEPNDDALALLFDINGNVAGIQSLTRHEHMLVPSNNYNYGAVPIFQNDTLNEREYLVVTIYFVRPNTICSTGLAKENIGKDSEIWFQNGATPAELREAPKTRNGAIAQGWNRNMCVPGMGWHNFYDVEHYADHDCREVQPHCILFNEFDEMIGFCLNMQGMATSTRYEYPTPEAVQYVLGPNPPPQCVVDATNNAGTTTLHVYFVNAPWRVGC